jgi:NADP-dependent 3-hydroxy acid dehydrogenase YdfG
MVSHRQRERFGRNFAQAVLESGDRLVATARDTKRLDDLGKKYGDCVHAVPLDVTDESAAQGTQSTWHSADRSLVVHNCVGRIP